MTRRCIPPVQVVTHTYVADNAGTCPRHKSTSSETAVVRSLESTRVRTSGQKKNGRQTCRSTKHPPTHQRSRAQDSEDASAPTPISDIQNCPRAADYSKANSKSLGPLALTSAANPDVSTFAYFSGT